MWLNWYYRSGGSKELNHVRALWSCFCVYRHSSDANTRLTLASVWNCPASYRGVVTGGNGQSSPNFCLRALLRLMQTRRVYGRHNMWVGQARELAPSLHWLQSGRALTGWNCRYNFPNGTVSIVGSLPHPLTQFTPPILSTRPIVWPDDAGAWWTSVPLLTIFVHR